MFLIFQPLYLQQLGASPVLIGAILGSWAIAMSVTHIPAGYLSDRVGRRPLMWAAWISGMVATWIMALAASLPVFVVGLLLYGMTSFVMSPMNSYVTAARGNWSVGRALSVVSAAYYAGAIAGPLIGGWVGSRFDLHRIYLAAAGLFVISTLLILRIRPQPIEPPHPETISNGLPLSRRYLHYLAVVFVAMFATYLAQPLASNYLQNQHLLNYDQIGRLGAISSLGVVIFSLFLGHLDIRLGFLLGQAACGLFALFLWKGSGLLWFGAGYFMLGGYKLARLMAAAQTRELVPPARMGLAYGLTESISASAAVLAPPLAGYLYSQQPTWMFEAGCALVAVSILLSAQFLFRARETGQHPTKIEEIIH